MKQKITWMLCLLIGISLISCTTDDVELPIQTATYTYYNRFPETIRIEIYNVFSQSSIEYNISPNDSMSFKSSAEGYTHPFEGGYSNSVMGDSVIIRFKDRHTISKSDYTSGTYGGNGIYDLTQYDNYSEELVNQQYYTLRYSIDSTDYKMAIPFK